jgi:hypothetical protein
LLAVTLAATAAGLATVGPTPVLTLLLLLLLLLSSKAVA